MKRKRETKNTERLKEVLEFCRKALYDMPLSEKEYSELECSVENYEEKRLHTRMKNMVAEEFEKFYSDSTEKKEGEEEVKKEEEAPYEGENERVDYVVKMRDTDSYIAFTIDNYVHVTYFVDAITGEPCNFNLVHLALKLLNYYVEYNCKKFAKVNLRHFRGPSHLLYKSSVLVETGSDNQALSRRLLKKTVSILREFCGYPHIKIDRRSCQNIVAAGYFNHSICPNVLKARYQDIRYNEEDFPGVVITQKTLKKGLPFINECSDSEDELLAEGEEVIEGGYVMTKDHRDDDNDSEIIREINHSIEESTREEKLLYDNLKRMKEENKDLSIKREDEEDDEEEGKRGAKRRKLSVKDEFMKAIMETDEFESSSKGGRRRNCTFLVFPKNQIICTGSKSVVELEKAFIPLCQVLDECKESNPENRKFEAELIRKKNQS